MRASMRAGVSLAVAVLLIAPPAAVAATETSSVSVSVPVPVTPEEARLLTAEQGGPSPRVVGGTEVSPPGKYPWIVSVQLSSHFCGGTLVTPTRVLSAAHCFTDSAGNPDVFAEDLTIVVGRHDLATSAGEEIAATDISIHPLWDGDSGGSFEWDITIIDLASPSAFTPATLASGADAATWDPGDLGTTMGWGDTDGSAPFTLVDKLQEVDVPFTNDAACDSAWPGNYFPGLQICAGDLVNGGVDSCVGDSGGPIVAPPGASGWKQVGIVSSGPVPCGNPGEPGLYSFIPNLRSFVTAETGGANLAPVADNDAVTTDENVNVVISVVGDLLAGDTDDWDFELLARNVVVDGSSLTGGTLTDNGDDTFTYDPDPGFSGTDEFTYIVSDSALAASAPATVTIDVIPSRSPPVADPQTGEVVEDPLGPLPVTLSGSDDDGDPLTFTIDTPPANGTLGPITSTGPTTATVDYTPDPDYFGADSFTFEVDDGIDGTDTATVSINVLPVNDPPNLAIGPDLTVLEDAGPQTAPGFVTIPVDPGATNEAGQIVTLTIDNDNNPLFATQPTISPAGTLTYTLAADANGITTVTITAQDDGGLDNSGLDTTDESFTIVVTPVNDPPVFTPGADQVVAEDAGPQTVAAWATGITRGPADESGQTLAFEVANDNNPLFATQPAISPAGTLTYTPAADANGAAKVDVVLRDSGGTANGGVDASPIESLTITVTPVNDAPVAVPDVATVGDGEVVDIAVTANDSDRDGDPLTVTILSGPSRGSASVVAGPKIRYVHDGSGAAADSLTYRLSDGKATSNTVAVSVTITDDGDGVTAAVENGAPNDGDGNADGIPDRRQGKVASLPNAVDGSYVTLVSAGGAQLSSVSAFAEPATAPPPDLEFPVGFFGYTVSPVPAGGLAIVDMLLHGDPEFDTFYKFGPTAAAPSSSRYYEFPFDGTAGAELTGGDVRLHLVDGADGDTDLAANGVIVDPSAPARTLTSPPPPPPPPVEGVGLVDPGQGRWHLRRADGTTEPFFYGNPGDQPFMGDWDCDGVDTPGLYRRSDGFVYLRNSNTAGVANVRYFFGDPADVAIAGDFNGDGCDTVSLYRPGEQRFYIINRLGSGDQGVGSADTFFTFGDPGDQPVSGDWDGDGVTEVGLHRETTGFFYWRNTLTTGVAHGAIFFGDPGDRFVAGDWGVIDGRDTPAVFRPTAATFFFRHSLTQGNADAQFQFGETDWLPVAGLFFTS